MIPRALARWARLVSRRPWTVVVSGIVLCALAAAAAVHGLGFKTARIALVGDTPFTRRHLALEEEFGDLNAIVVAVSAEDPEITRLFLDALEQRVAADPEHFLGAFVRVDPARLGGNALLFVDDATLVDLAQRTERAAPELRRGGALAYLGAFAAELEGRLALGPGPAGGGADMVELGSGLLTDLRRSLEGEAVAEGPLHELPWDTQGYTFTADGCGVALISYREKEGSLDPRMAAVGALRDMLAGLREELPGIVEVGLTGKPVLEVDEMRTYERDTVRSSVAALLGVTVLLVLAFRRWLGPLLIGACLVLAIALTLGLTVVWPGHLNLMAVVFVVIVIGLGVDFGIHLVARYDQERLSNSPPGPALEAALRNTGPAILAGGLTTAGAFVVAVFTDFKGLREFGAVACFGVLASLAIMGSVLPALVVALDRWRVKAPPPAPGALLSGWERWATERASWVVGAVVALTLTGALLAPRLEFDGNLLHMQDPDLDSVQWELRLMDDEQMSGWFLAYPTRDLGELRRAADAVSKLPGVDRVSSVLDVLPQDQQQRLPTVRQVQGRLRDALAAEREIPTTAAWAEATDRLIDVLEDALEQAVAGGAHEGLETLEGLLEQAEALRDAIPEEGERGGRLPLLALAYDALLDAELRARLEPVASPEAEALTTESLPPRLRDRLVGSRGSALLRIYPKANLWDPAELEAFLTEVRSVLPEVTGVPVLLHESSRLMQRGYQQAGGYALIVVVLCLALHFRKVGTTLLALLTLGVGGTWLVGAMVVLGLPLNPANLVALPLLLGIGIDTAVHVIHRAEHTKPGEPLVASSLGRALIYSGLTTVAGFGSLMLGDHPGTSSIGSTISLGVFCCVLAGLTVPPAVLALVRRAPVARP